MIKSLVNYLKMNASRLLSKMELTPFHTYKKIKMALSNLLIVIVKILNTRMLL